MKINDGQKTNDLFIISGMEYPDPQRLLLWGPFGLALLIPGLFFVWLYNYSPYQKGVTNHIAAIFFALMMVIMGMTIFILGFFQRPGSIKIYKSHFDYSYPIDLISELETKKFEFKEIIQIKISPNELYYCIGPPYLIFRKRKETNTGINVAMYKKNDNDICCVEIVNKMKKYKYIHVKSSIAEELIKAHQKFKSNNVEKNWTEPLKVDT